MMLETKPFDNTKNYKEYENQSGVYALLYNKEVIYVGQSKNVKERLSQHHARLNTRKGLYMFLKNHIQWISFLVLPLELNELDKNEEYYINKYKPRFNIQGVKTPYKAPTKKYLW